MPKKTGSHPQAGTGQETVQHPRVTTGPPIALRWDTPAEMKADEKFKNQSFLSPSLPTASVLVITGPHRGRPYTAGWSAMPVAHAQQPLGQEVCFCGQHT